MTVPRGYGVMTVPRDHGVMTVPRGHDCTTRSWLYHGVMMVPWCYPRVWYMPPGLIYIPTDLYIYQQDKYIPLGRVYNTRICYNFWPLYIPPGFGILQATYRTPGLGMVTKVLYILQAVYVPPGFYNSPGLVYIVSHYIYPQVWYIRPCVVYSSRPYIYIPENGWPPGRIVASRHYMFVYMFKTM